MVWYVVADYPDEAKPEYTVWTVSRDPTREGWNTDSGIPGYGLTKADAEHLAKCANAFEAAERSRAWDENPPPPGAREMGS